MTPSAVAAAGDIHACPVSVAPMMDWTDRHCRFFHRQLHPGAVLYTEMVTTGAIIHGDRDRFLAFDPDEHPVALQLGGSDPDELARACEIANAYRYDEINLNVGCPSDRVQKGRFGACLMTEPALVAECMKAMANASQAPVTVKTRIGVDDQDSEAFLHEFIDTVAQAGVERFIIHARKAWLSGLSPKENREVPPLNYPRVIALRQRFPGLKFILNGGLTDAEQALSLLDRVDGVMLGRAAYQNPWILAELAVAGGLSGPASRRAVVATMADYADRHIATGGQLKHVARHMLGLFHGQPGARSWRQRLSQEMHLPSAGPELLLSACPEAP
ncbi:MAG: tRNA dihydrouridine(20/20a) synthase DusA [Wenzhouxiangella sp.]